MPRLAADLESLSATSSDSETWSDPEEGSAAGGAAGSTVGSAAGGAAGGALAGRSATRAAVKIQSVVRGKQQRRQQRAARNRRASVSEQLGGENYAGPDGELAAGLFSGWTLHAAPNGKQYWRCKGSGKSEWVEPKCCREHREATSVDGWVVHPAPNGLPYWHNENTQESVWVEPPAMKRRRKEYAAHEQSVQEMHLASPAKNKNSAVPSLETPAQTSSSSSTSATTATPSEPGLKNVAQVLQQLRHLCADTDPSEAFKLFALASVGRGDFIPVSIFAASIMKICPGVDKTLAASVAHVFDRADAGLVGEKSFVEIVYDRAEMESRAAHVIHEKMLVVIAELRDILATQVQFDGTRGFSETDLKRHFNNMKLRLQDEHVSRGQFVKVLRDIGLHASGDVLHAVADEFVPLGKTAMSYKNFVAIVKRESDVAGTHKELMQRRAEKARQRRPRPTPTARTKREANAVLARFQQRFHTQTTSVEHLHTVFEGFDRYADGHIKRSDFLLAMKELDFTRSHEALNVVIDILDPDETGYIAWHNFFDTLATEATSGLTPRCLNIDGLATTNARGASRSHRHHGYTMSPSRRRIMKKQRPPQYPAFHEMTAGSEEQKQNLAAAEVLMEALRTRMRDAAIAGGSGGSGNDSGSSNGSGVRKGRKVNLQLAVPGTAVATAAAASKKSAENSRVLGFCMNTFDNLDKTKTGVLSALRIFRYLKMLKLSTPAPKLELIWHVVSLIDKSGDGTIQLYDWLYVTAQSALSALANDMLFDVRTMYHENLTDPAGQAAFFDMFCDVQVQAPGDDVLVEIVPLTKFLSALSSLEREELSSITARYLWSRLAGEDAPSMLWTEFLLSMTDRTGKFGFTPRPVEAPASPRGVRRGSSGREPMLFSPTSRTTDSNQGVGTHRSVAERALEERIARIWEDLLAMIEPEAGTSQWEKMDAIRVEFAEVTTAAGEALSHKQFVRLLRNLGVFEQGNIMDRVTREFDLEGSGRISWSDFIVGLLERPIREADVDQATRRNARTVFRCVRKHFEQDEARSPRSAASGSGGGAAATAADAAAITLEQRIGRLFEVFSAAFSYGGDDEEDNEETMAGMTYVDFKRMLAFMCDIGKAKGGGEEEEEEDKVTGPILSDPETMEYMCLLFDHDKNGMISAEEIMACVMPQNLFRDKALRAKTKRRTRRASQREVKEAERRREARLAKEEEEEVRRRAKKKEEDEAEEERRRGEVEAGAYVEATAAVGANRGRAQEEDFEEEDGDVEDLLGGAQGPLGGDSAIPAFEDNDVELGASHDFEPAAAEELEQDMGRTQKRDKLGDQLRSNKEQLMALMKMSEENAQLCVEIESSRLFLDQRNRLKDAGKVAYREVPDVTHLVDADVAGKYRTVLEAVTLHAGLSNIAPQGDLTDHAWGKPSGSSRSGSGSGGGTELTFQRSLAQWKSALDTWTRVLDSANVTMRKVSITAGAGRLSLEDANAVQASLLQVSTEVRSTKMQVYRESDYWFEQSATRQSGALRFVRNLKAPPQHVYERMLTISSAFREVEARVLKIRESLQLHTPRGAGVDRGMAPTPPAGKDEASVSAAIAAARSPKKVQLLARIKEKEKILRHRRRKALNAALLARGLPWPPVLVDAPAWCMRLHDRFLVAGASAVPFEEGGSVDDLGRAKEEEEETRKKAQQHKKGSKKSKRQKVAEHQSTMAHTPVAKDTNSPGPSETWTRRLVDRVADILVAGVGKASRQSRTQALARGQLAQRTRELETALATVGLGKAHPAVVVTAPYNAYVTQTLPGNVWTTIAQICHRLETRRCSRRDSLTRVFRSIDVRETGVLDHKAVIRFAVRRKHVEKGYFLPKCVSVLLQGRRYHAALREASAKKDGRVSLEDFVTWAMARWTPSLPGTRAAGRELRRRVKEGPGVDGVSGGQ